MAFDGFRKIRCPFCANEYRLGDFAIYSETLGAVTKEAPKTRFQKLIYGVRVKSLEGRDNTLAKTLRQCPNCGRLLPFNIEYVEDNITIAIIGDTSSGKSHYIAAAIQQMKERSIPPELQLTEFSASAPGIEDKYKNDYYEPLFKRNEPLRQTMPATSPLDDPLIYEMRIRGKYINLLIYDASGEDIAEISKQVHYKPHILNAKAMIFLADPWSMPNFVDQLAHHLRPDPKLLTGRMSADILSNVIHVFKRALGQARNTQFSLPVAIALSKSDLLPYVITRSGNPLYSALADPQYPSLLNRSESSGIHATVRQLLQEIGEYSLVSMEQTIERINFSAITATGVAQDSQGKYPKVVPHRCLDPLFWVLRELEIVQ